VASMRRLASIMFTDMVGSTAAAQANEAEALRLRDEQETIVRPLFSAHRGRDIKSIGDGFLVVFESALRAVQCAIQIQEHLQARNSKPGVLPILLRIGVHLGDVEERDGDVFGDSVNVASRIEPLAEPGGVCISEMVFGQVRNKIPNQFEKLDPRALKGVLFPVDLYRIRLDRTEMAPSPADSPPSPLEMSRIAVLPFVSMSPDPNDEYFADGMTEEIIDRLSQVKELQVIARTSVMTYKKRAKKAVEIARELFVGSVVEGSVRKAGDKVRVTAQLVHGGTEAHLWSSHYDGNLDDVFAVQSEIAERVAGELKIQLLHSERKSLEKKPTENMEAYGDFLRGRELFREGSELSLRQALRLFERTVELDRSFAKAHVAVAECHQRLAGIGYEPMDVMLLVVRDSLKHALELEPDLAEAHSSLAELRLNEDDLAGAEAEARRAAELCPSLPEPYRMLSEIAGIKGKVDDMVRFVETAYRLDPISTYNTGSLGIVYFFTGREQEALEFWRKTENLNPAGTYRNSADYYLSKGNVAKAREMYAKFERLQPTHPWVTYTGGCIDAMSGESQKALQAIQQVEGAKMGPVAYNYVAYIYHALGDMDGYFDNINRAMEEHAINSTAVMYSPLLAKAREDPRYKELVEKLRR
jgi:adenylate cyclase